MIQRLLVVGAGSSGRRHLRIARELLPDARIALVSRTAADDLSSTFGSRRFSTIEEAMEIRPDAAIVANPATLHLEAAMPLAAHGVHLLIEKPLAASEAGVGDLARASAERRSIVMVGYNLRFLPSLVRFREMLGEGRIGRVLSVRAEVGQWLPSWRPEQDYRTGVSARSQLGGGALLELSHEIDYLRWLFGDVEWVAAVELRLSDLEIDVEDTAHLLLGLAGRGKAPIVATLSMDFVRRDATRICTAIGSEGSLRWDGIADSVGIFEPAKGAWQTLFQGSRNADESYVAELRHFIESVSGDRQPALNLADGLAAIRVVDAARLSSRTGARVTLDGGYPVVTKGMTQ